MKLYLSLISMLIVGWNTYAADIYVNNSGQAGTYTTISAAITAAVAGDKIYVSPYGVYTENLAIAKSLTIVSAVPNTRFSVVGNVTITSAPTQEVIIIGGEFSSNINGNTGTATLASKGFVTISDCKFNNSTINDFIVSKVLFSESIGNISVKHGKIIACLIGRIQIYDGPNSGIGDTIFIIGNKIKNYFIWDNDDNYFFVANNKIITPDYEQTALYFTNHFYNSSINNNIVNNTLASYPYSTWGVVTFDGSSNNNRSNILLVNNIIESLNGGYSFYANAITPLTYPKLLYNFLHNSPSNPTNFGAQFVVGNISISSPISPALVFDELGKSTNTTYVVNQGSPALQYYDIDLTRNDIGTFGGPYSIDNYWNTATGRARVYDLNMPFEIWNGSTPSIKAEGTHIK